MSAERVLVLGGAGFIGSFIVDALLRAGHHVRVLDNLDPQVHGGLREAGLWPDYCHADAEYCLGDIRDHDALRHALQDIEVVFHKAAAVGVGQSMYEIERYVDVNTRGTATLLDILVNDKTIRSRVRKLVVASSMSIYGEGAYFCPVHGVVYPAPRPVEQLADQAWELRCAQPAAYENGNGNGNGHRHAAGKALCGERLSPLPTGEHKPLYPTSVYAITKRDQEELCLSVGRAYDLPTVALRYFNAFGPRQALSNPYTGVAAIFCSRLLNGKPPIIFEDGQQRRDFVHVSDIVQANLLAMNNPKADYQAFNVGTGQPISILAVAQLLAQHLQASVVPQIVSQYRAGDIRHCYPDISRLQALGYQPSLSFQDGVTDLVDWVSFQTAEDRFSEMQHRLAERQLVR